MPDTVLIISSRKTLTLRFAPSQNIAVKIKSGNRQYKPDDQITRIDGALPAIISKETWDKVQDILTSRKRKPRHNQSYYYLLTGKMFCSECGSAYVGSGYEYGRGKVKNYQYSCNGRLRHKCECTNKPIRCEKIERYVLDPIGEVLSEDTIQSLTDKMMDMLNKKAACSCDTEKSLESKLEDVKRKITKTWALYYDGSLPKENIVQQIEVLTQQQKDVETQIVNANIFAEKPSGKMLLPTFTSAKRTWKATIRMFFAVLLKLSWTESTYLPKI